MGSFHVDRSPQHSVIPCLKSENHLLPNIIDSLASTKPLAPYGYYPVSPDGYDQGFRKLSYRDFANLVNGLAWWITAQLGRSSCSTQEALVYTGPNDFCQNAMILACYKAGYKLLLTSPRNQPSALQSLLKEVQCKALLAADPGSPFASAIVKAAADAADDNDCFILPCFQVPSIDTLLRYPFPHYPCQKTLEEAREEVLLILHTSGTTAAPKPIAYTNSWVAAYLQMLRSPPPPNPSQASTETTSHNYPSPSPSYAEFDERWRWDMKDIHLRGTRLFVMMAPFHAANIFCTSFMPVADDTIIILPPANQVLPTTESFLQAIVTREIETDTAFVPPHMISQIASSSKLMDIVGGSPLTIVSGGAKIVEDHGNLLDSRLRSSGRGRLLTLYGATETGSFPELMPPISATTENTWNYLSPHPAAGCEFRETTPDGNTGSEIRQEKIYEAWIVRPSSWSYGVIDPPVFSLAGHATSRQYRTKDRFTSHPSIPGLWKWHSRVDDTIVLATGANVPPVAMEDGILGAAAAGELSGAGGTGFRLTGVLMVGTGYPRPVLLVEVTVSTPSSIATKPGDDSENGSAESNYSSDWKDALLDQLWLVVERINERYYFVDHRIRGKKDIILIYVPGGGGGGMVRSLKGAVQRGSTVERFRGEIESLFAM
ncbi:acetyl-CoA synthetase-like protein [Rhypophila sp. PSN 637]